MPQDQDTYVDPPEVNPASPHVDPPSPATNPPSPAANPPSPARAAAKPSNADEIVDGKTDDVVITGFGHTTPGDPVALSKHSAKEEFIAVDKGKWKTDFSSYAHLSAQDIHSRYLNRLYTSRDYEAGLVGLMKEQYEVNIVNSA